MENEASPAPKKRPLLQTLLVGRNPVWTIVRILFVVFVSIILFKFVLLPIRVEGTSMYPTYKNGQIRLINRLAYRSSTPQRGDVVAAELAGHQVLILKRVIGLPGERVQIVDGHIHINGDQLVEPYANGIVSINVEDQWGGGHELRTSKVIKVPDAHYFLIGDNREKSEMALPPRHKIVGKALF